MMPFGPASTFSTLALRQSALIATILKSCVHSSGKRAEAIGHLGGKSLDLLVVLQRRETTIKVHAKIEILYIAFRYEDRRADGDGRRPLLLDLRLDAGLQGCNSLLQHLLIEFVADLLDMAGLFVAKKVAGAPDVEIVAGELEAWRRAYPETAEP